MKKKLLICLMVLALLASVLVLPAYADETEGDSQTTVEENTENSGEDNTEDDSKTEEDSKSEDDSKTEEDNKTEDGEKTEDSDSDKETVTGCEHKWNSGTVTAEATCEKEGSAAFSCSICGETKTEVIAKRSHTYDNACDTGCNLCDHTRETTHKPGKQWSSNFGGHWHICTVCGKKTDEADHYPGPAATEEKDQICLTCGYLLTKKLSHSHQYATEWTTDETGHWYACTGCEEQKDYQQHSFDNVCDPDCNECGYVTDAAHSFGTTLGSDETSHWPVCSVCGAEGEREDHIPGTEASQNKAQECVICNLELTPASGHVHTPGEEWVSDETFHWKDCECGEKVQETAHSWDKGTAGEDGTVIYTCSECGEEKTETGEPAVETEAGNGFPWGIVIAAVAVACCGAVVLILLLRPKKKAGKFAK